MEPEPGRGLPRQHEVGHDGGWVVVGVDVGGDGRRIFLGHLQFHEVGSERAGPREVPVGGEARRGGGP